MIGLFCRILSLLKDSFAKETYNFIDPTNQSHLIQYVVVCTGLLHTFAVCCSLSQSVAVCCTRLQSVAVRCSLLQSVAVCCSLLQSVAHVCSLLQCATLYCCFGLFDVCVLQCVAVRCSES